MNGSEPSYKELESCYKKYFSSGNLAADINEKFAMISLIGYMVTSMKKKNPDVTYYEVCRKLMEKLGFDDLQIKGFAVVIEDFSHGCSDFPTFGIQPKDMPAKVREILSKYLPF